MSPARRTAAPSTNVSTSGSVTGPPAASAAATQAAPAGSAPMTRTPGCRSPSQATDPASRPPPPTGMTITSGARPSWATISRATVPWPAIVRGASNAGTSVDPAGAEARGGPPRPRGGGGGAGGGGGGRRGLVVGVAAQHDLHHVAAQRGDPVPLLPRRGARQGDPAPYFQRPPGTA